MFVLITFYKKELTGLLTDNLKINYGLNLNLKVENIDVSFFDNWFHYCNDCWHVIARMRALFCCTAYGV